MGVLGFFLGFAILIWWLFFSELHLEDIKEYFKYRKYQTKKSKSYDYCRRHILNIAEKSTCNYYEELDDYHKKEMENMLFSPNLHDKNEKAKIYIETPYRNLWAKLFKEEDYLEGCINKSLLKYYHPNKEVEVALNLEYAMGYKGYSESYDLVSYIHPCIQGEINLAEVDRCRDNPEYFTPAYFYNYYYKNTSDDVISLIGKKMSLLEFNLELKKRQYLVNSRSIYYRNHIDDDVKFNNEFIETSDRFDDRDWEFGNVKLDIRDRIYAFKTPRYLYDQYGTMSIHFKLSGNDDVYQKIEKLPANTIIEIEGINLPNNSAYVYDYDVEYNLLKQYNSKFVSDEKINKYNKRLLSFEDLPSKDKMEEYRKKLWQKARKLENKNVNVYGYRICNICQNASYDNLRTPNTAYICKDCRKKYDMPFSKY